MSKDYGNIDTVLDQGIRSRFDKACAALDAADELIPENAYDGNAEELRQCIMRLNTAMTNLAELIAYRKIMGVD